MKKQNSEMRDFKDEMYKAYLFNMALYEIEPMPFKEWEKEIESFELPKKNKL